MKRNFPERYERYFPKKVGGSKGGGKRGGKKPPRPLWDIRGGLLGEPPKSGQFPF